MKKEIPEQFQKSRYERNMFSKLKEQTTITDIKPVKYFEKVLSSSRWLAFNRVEDLGSK